MFSQLFSFKLKVLSYWNLNSYKEFYARKKYELKVLSYWNLNLYVFVSDRTKEVT